MNIEYSSLPPQLLLLGLPQVQGLQPSPCRPATVNQLQANISKEVAQIDPDMIKRTMLDIRERAVKCRAAGGRHMEKQSSYQLYPCLVTDGSLMRCRPKWIFMYIYIYNIHFGRHCIAHETYVAHMLQITHCPMVTQLDLSKQSTIGFLTNKKNISHS